MLALLLLLAQPAEAGRPFFGLEIKPLSRRDLVWVEEDRTSGTAVGEFDGTGTSVLSAFGGGWFNRYVGLQGSLGVALTQQRTDAGEVTRQRTIAVLRPALDVRLGWAEPKLRRPLPWVLVGGYGDIPISADVSNGYSEEEQAAADEAVLNERYRLGGGGGRVGFGVDLEVIQGLALGMVATIGLHRSGYAGGDPDFASLWLATDASLLLTYLWPERRKNRDEAVSSETAPQAP